MRQPVPPPIILLLLTLSLPGCASAPAPPTSEVVGADGPSVLVVNHGLHAGLLIARADLVRQLPTLAEPFGAGDWLELGWGDEGFYRAPQASLGLALRALLQPTPAVLHVQASDGDPRRRFAASEVVGIRLREDGYRQLLEFVAASFSRSPQGTPSELGPGLYGQSRFYRAEGRYSLLRTCNTWLAEALAASGCPLQASTLITTTQLLDRLQQMPGSATLCRLDR